MVIHKDSLRHEHTGDLLKELTVRCKLEHLTMMWMDSSSRFHLNRDALVLSLYDIIRFST
jgi:hypothetical protein